MISLTEARRTGRLRAAAMEPDEIDRLATEYANKIALAPKFEPGPGAFLAAVACGGVLLLFMALAGINEGSVEWAVMITVAVVAGATYWGLKGQRDKHFNAWHKEFNRLHDEREAKLK